jgi:hypothetical protein
VSFHYIVIEDKATTITISEILVIYLYALSSVSDYLVIALIIH